MVSKDPGIGAKRTGVASGTLPCGGIRYGLSQRPL